MNVGENDQRTLTLSELVDAYNAGVITQDTFIWCDGMDDWWPVAEVEAVVVAALHASANQFAASSASRAAAFEPRGAPAYEAPAATSYEPPAAADPPGYDAPAAAYVAPAAYAAPATQATPAPEPTRAAVAKREARARDLFATNAGEELHTSAPVTAHAMAPPAGDASSLTGQRNENSVLFSLAVLTKSADARPTFDAPATKDDSGLIDLKALAQKAESMRPIGMGGTGGMGDANVFHAPLGLTPMPVLGTPVGALGSFGVLEGRSRKEAAAAHRRGCRRRAAPGARHRHRGEDRGRPGPRGSPHPGRDGGGHRGAVRQRRPPR